MIPRCGRLIWASEAAVAASFGSSFAQSVGSVSDGEQKGFRAGGSLLDALVDDDIGSNAVICNCRRKLNETSRASPN